MGAKTQKSEEHPGNFFAFNAEKQANLLEYAPLSNFQRTEWAPCSIQSSLIHSLGHRVRRHDVTQKVCCRNQNLVFTPH